MLDIYRGSPYTIPMETTLYMIYLQAAAVMLAISMMMMEMEERAWVAHRW